MSQSEHFKKVGPNAAINLAQGYKVARVDRNTVIYQLKDRKFTVEVEPGDGLAIYGQTLQMLQGQQFVNSIEESERRAILKNISDALTFLNIQHFIA